MMKNKSLSYVNQSINLQKKSTDLFLCDKDIRHETFEEFFKPFVSLIKAIFALW